MESRLILGGGALLLVMGAWNAYALHDLETRMTALEGSALAPESRGVSASGAAAVGSGASGSESVAMAAVGSNTTRASGGQGRRSSVSSGGDGLELGVESSSLDLDDPEAREALAVFLEDYEEIRKQEKREQGVAQYLDYVSAEAEAFAEENGVDDGTMGEIISIIETGTYEYVAIEHAAKDGEMDWSEAKPQLKAIREEGKASLQALLGEEAYDEFEARVWGSGRD